MISILLSQGWGRCLYWSNVLGHIHRWIIHLRWSLYHKQCRNFDPIFKLELVRMLTEKGLSISNVIQAMDIVVTAIGRWMEQYKAEQ